MGVCPAFWQITVVLNRLKPFQHAPLWYLCGLQHPYPSATAKPARYPSSQRTSFHSLLDHWEPCMFTSPWPSQCSCKDCAVHSPGTLHGTNLHPTHLFPHLTDLLLPLWTPEPAWPMAIDRHSVGRRSCPTCLHPLAAAPAVFSSPPGLLRADGEDKEKGVQTKSLPMAGAPSPSRHFMAPTPTWASFAAPGSTGEVNNNSQLGQLDNLTITSGTLHHSHTHTPVPWDLLQTPAALRSPFPTSCTSFWSYASSSLAPCLRGSFLSWVKQQDEIDCWDVQTITRGFLACLLVSSCCRGFSGMAIETEEAWKGERVVSTQLIMVFGLLIL